ncbi:MAG: hypothetical protein ACRDN0_09255, partial [Trebonia sp.]
MTPIPAAASSTGPAPSSKVNSPRGAATSSSSPAARRWLSQPLAAPCGSCFTLIRYVPVSG